jgi:hypothetical protein
MRCRIINPIQDRRMGTRFTKRQIEKRNEGAMKYFTPDLYLRFNATNDNVADEAELAWEQALEQYKRYLKEHRSNIPANVRSLAEKCCFHDAALLGWQTHEQRSMPGSDSQRMLTIGLQHRTEMAVLYYFLSNSPKETKRRKSWPYSAEHKHWLYDEVAVVDDSVSAHSGYDFVHRILWSDGSEMEIPFTDVIIDRYPSLSPAAAQ